MAAHFLGPIRNKEIIDHPRGLFSNLPVNAHDPSFVTYMNDFLKAGDYNTTDFTRTTVGSTGNSVAVLTSTSQVNGYLSMVAGSDNPGSESVQGKQDSWKFDTANASDIAVSAQDSGGKRLWFETRIQASRVSDADILVGLGAIDTTPLDDASFVGFSVANGSAAISAVAGDLGGTNTSLATGSSLVASTDIRLGYYYDGKGTVRVYVNRSYAGKISTNIPTAALALTAHVKSNSANANTLLVDYLWVVAER